jgi:hypothetical protein
MKSLVLLVISSIAVLSLIGCVDDSSEGGVSQSETAASSSMPALDMDTSEDTSASVAESGVSECGREVLTESPHAYQQCFEGGANHFGACETCGYYGDESKYNGEYDCITCSEGWEIDVVFRDCTGHCVKAGTAVNPIIGSGCEPVSECVLAL